MQIVNKNTDATFSGWVRNNHQTKKALVYAIKQLNPNQRKEALNIVRTLDKTTPNHDLYASNMLPRDRLELYADSDELSDILVQQGIFFNNSPLRILKKFQKLVEKNENILKD